MTAIPKPELDIQGIDEESAAELQLLKSDDEGDMLRPDAIVAFAKDPTTALHRHFCWDDTEAAHNYRLWQARRLIAVAVTVLTMDKPAYRAYVSLSSDRKTGGGYRDLGTIMSNRRLYAEMMQDALDELERLQRKYGALTELKEVWKAARKLRPSK